LTDLVKQIDAFEWEIAEEQVEQQNAHWPDISLFAVAVAWEYLRGHVGLGTAVGDSSFIIIDWPGQPEIPYFADVPSLAVAFQQNVLQFDISMNDIFGMDFLEPIEYLLEDIDCIR